MKKTTIRLVGAGVLGATVLGSVAAGVVAASPATAAPTKAVSATQDVTRGFDIVNMTKYTLELVNVDNPGARDGYAPTRTTIAPGQSYHYEKVYYFGRTLSTTLTFQWDEALGGGAHRIGVIDTTLQVDLFGGTMVRVDDADKFTVDNQGWSGRATLMEKDFSTVTVPASEAQKQAELLNQTCVSGLASCTFLPTSKVAGEPQVKLVAGGVNNTATARPESFTTKVVATTTSSVETTGSAKVTIGGILEAGLTHKYGGSWSQSREETKVHSYTMNPFTSYNMWSRVPTERVTGDFTVILGKTTWKLTGVSFDLPNKSGAVLYDSSERALTEQEKASLPPIAEISPRA